MDSINNACKFGSDAWLELQAFKTRQLNRREKLNRHKNLHKDLINGIALNQNHHQPPINVSASASSSANLLAANNSTSATNHHHQQNAGPSRIQQQPQPGSSSSSLPLTNNHSKYNPDYSLLNGEDVGQRSNTDTSSACNSNNTSASKSISNDSPPMIIEYNNHLSTTTSTTDSSDRNHLNLELVECLLLLKLCDVALKLPIDSRSLQRSISKIRSLESTSQCSVENLLQKFAHQELITIDEPTTASLTRRNKQITIGPSHHTGGGDNDEDDESCIYVTSADHTKLVEFDKSFGSDDYIRGLLIESKSDDPLGADECDGQQLTVNNLHGSVPIQTARTSSNYQAINSLGDRDDNSRDAKHQQQDNSDPTDLERSSFSSIKVSISCNNNNNSNSNSNNNNNTKHEVESLLSLSSTRERESKKLGEELLELLSKPTAKERNLLERFRSADGYQVQEFCPKGTKGECRRNNKGITCDKLHFKKIIAKHTEESLGDCSFLNTCFHMDSCKYVHYEVDYDEKQAQQHQFKRPHPADPYSKQTGHDSALATTSATTNNDHAKTSSTQSSSSTSNSDSNNKTVAASISLPGTACLSASKYTLSPEEQAIIDAKNRKRFKTVLYPPQWIQCDLRFFDMSLLGKFSVVMADPPWDIHMELPYGTMSDDEMRKLNIPALQDEGVIFLWVTGRAMELGRECLALWGYERCDEIIWVKTNQLQRIIRTGRTGHWLNHGKEHCLVGVKGNPKDINRGLDCDVIVAEVRATSHKPDEIYGIIERLSPGTRKIELFGRAHNVQPNWITLGNQLNGVRLIEPSLVNAFKKLNLPFQTAD